MIKPEQVPDAAAHALIQSDIMLMSAKEQIAAALSAWPNAFEYRSAHANYGQCLSLPLTAQEEVLTITPSCGCVFCDIGTTHPDGVKCTNWHDGGA